MPAPPLRCAYVTLVTSADYIQGAVVLMHSLRLMRSQNDVTPARLLVYTPDSIRHNDMAPLHHHLSLGTIHRLIAVPRLSSHGLADSQLSLLARPELHVTLTKLYSWHSDLIGAYDKVCFLDADTLVLKDISDIFDYISDPPVMDANEDNNDSVVFAAAPDIGWPDCFNSGVMVLRPDMRIFHRLMEKARTPDCSFDGGDQGLLNAFFSTWSTGNTPLASSSSRHRHRSQNQDTNSPPPPRSARLPFTFNVTPSATYSYLPAYQQYYADIRIVHFIGTAKPWRFERWENGAIVPIGSIPNQTLHMVERWWYFYGLLQEYDHRHAGKATNPHHMTDNLHRNVLATYKRDAPFLTHGSGTSTTTAPRGRHPLSKPIGHHKPSSSSLLRPGSSSTRPRSSSPTKQQQQQQIKGKTPASPQLKATSADTSSNIASNNNAMSDFGSYRIDWDIRDMIISPNGSRSGSMALRTTSSGGGGGQRIGSASSATTTASSSKARSELGDSEIDHLDGLGSPSSFSDDAAGGLGTGGGGGGEGSSSNLFLDGEEDEYLSEELEENELKRLRKEGIKQMKRLAAQQQQQTFLYSTGGEYHDHHQGMRGIGGGGGGSVDDEDSTTNTTTPSSDGIPVSPYQHHQYYQSQQQHQGGGSSGSSTPKIKPSSSFGVGGSNFVLDTYAGTTGHQRPTSAAVAANSSGIGSSGVSGSVASGSDSGSRTSPVASPDISAAVSGAAVSPLTSPDLAPVATNTNAALLSSSSSSYSSSSSSASSSNNNPTVLRALLPPLPPISEKRFESSTATASSFGKTNQKMQASQAEHLPTRFSQSDILKVLLNSNVASVAPAAESYSSASSMTTTTPSIPPLVPRILHKSASVSSLASNEKTTTTTTMTTAVSCSESDTSSFAGLNSGYPNAATPTAKKKKKKSNNKKKKKSKK